VRFSMWRQRSPSAFCHRGLSSPLVLGCLGVSLFVGAFAHGEPDVGKPRFAIRELYAPGHFGNSYEVMGENEMRRMLEEAVFWGFNRYGDWFDMIDCSDPFIEERFVNQGHALWEKKKANFRSAQALGLPCDLIVTPNHVYLDQCVPDLKAKGDYHVFGQLICPSKPEARAIILKNYENLFADLARSGVRLSSLCCCPYDYGGCACDQCKPWILTYAKLVREIHSLCKRYHPDVELRHIGWWWKVEEHRLLTEWAERDIPGQTKTNFLHIPYDKMAVDNVGLPRGCQRGAFVHIGYGDLSSPGDSYGQLGPIIAPDRLPKTLDNLAKQGVTDLMAYSEGVFDDVNKALYAGLASGKFRTTDDVLRAYAKRYFGVDHQTAGQWAAWLKTWGSPYAVNTAESRKQLDALLAKTPKGDWRRRQWELKLELFRLHGEIAKGNVWTPERLALVDQFWSVREEIHRGLWGLGPELNIFARKFCPIPWYVGWAKHVSEKAEALGKER
jgi:hypothetical protein